MRNLLLALPLCFVIGLVADVLVTGYYLLVSHGQSVAAASLCLPIAVMNFRVIDAVLLKGSPWHEIAYGLGNAVGCYLIMRYMKGKKCKK